jgi:class 3 adenylate cyclase/ketosteroid isomerase-like protein
MSNCPDGNGAVTGRSGTGRAAGPSGPDETAVLVAHDQFWQSYARRDLDRRFAVCADDITFFGTGQYERAGNKEQYRAMNQKGVEQFPWPFTIDPLWTEVRVLGDVAWTECDAYWIQDHGGTVTRDLIRQTTVMHKREGRWLVVHVHGSEPDYRLQEGEFMTNARIIARNKELEGLVAERTRLLNQEKKRSEDLLLNILPEQVAEELKAKGSAEAKLFSNVTVLFTDFKNFTQVSELLSPAELVAELNACFTAFDNLLGKYRIEKIKTVGDAYLAVAGLPQPYEGHAEEMVALALDIRAFIRERHARLGDHSFDIRIGIHSGEVVAGIVGVRKFAYDVWGDTVNTAARMEQNCPPGEINISASTHALVHDRFRCTPRGEITAKNKGALAMYLVEGRA